MQNWRVVAIISDLKKKKETATDCDGITQKKKTPVSSFIQLNPQQAAVQWRGLKHDQEWVKDLTNSHKDSVLLSQK